MKRSISAFEPGAVMEFTAFPFRYSTRVGMSSIPSAPASRGSTIAHFTVALLPPESLHVVHRSGAKSFRQAVGRSR
jgi:hypothetical protein